MKQKNIEVRFEDDVYRIYRDGVLVPSKNPSMGYRFQSVVDREAEFKRNYEFFIVTNDKFYHCMFLIPGIRWLAHCSTSQNRYAIFTQMRDALRFMKQGDPRDYEILDFDELKVRFPNPGDLRSFDKLRESDLPDIPDVPKQSKPEKEQKTLAAVKTLGYDENTLHACGCTATMMCPTAQKLYEAYESAGKRYERLPTGGNEYGLSKTMEAYYRHLDPLFSVPGPAVGYGVQQQLGLFND